MTCREKLKIEHPEAIDDDYVGGCDGCPHEYGYESRPSWCVVSHERCTECWDRDITGTEETVPKGPEGDIGHAGPRIPVRSGRYPWGEEPKTPKILDSGTRREFESGAVRDIQEGKGRCDLLPLDVVVDLTDDPILIDIAEYQNTGKTDSLRFALMNASRVFGWEHCYTMLLEVSKHFEEGANKYGEYNWQKGIPTHCYIDSAVRHYLKWKRGDEDEPHDRAFCWNILCCIWTCKHKPELNDYARK